MTNIRKLPNEIFCELFSYLDKETKLTASQVCRQWRIVMHYMSWRSISDRVEGDRMMKEDFSSFGWLKDEHEFGQCRCIELDLGYYPFRNTSWTTTSYGNTLYQREGAVTFAKSKIICAGLFFMAGFFPKRSLKTSFSIEHEEDEYQQEDSEAEIEQEDDDDDQWEDRYERKFVTTRSLHELDLEQTSPSWKEIHSTEYVSYDAREGIGRQEVSIVLKSHDNTMFLQEKFYKLPEIRITLWNIKPWAFVCDLPFQEIINDIIKSISGDSQEPLAFKFTWNLHLEVTNDILAVSVDVSDLNVLKVRALVLLWKFDASNPTTPNFLNYIVEEKDHLVGLHINAKYFCKRKSETLEVFALDDIKNNAFSKSWFVHSFGEIFESDEYNEYYDASDECGDVLLEPGKSNRLAVIHWIGAEPEQLSIFNIESGDRLLNLDLETHSPTSPRLEFHLGNLIFVQTRSRSEDPSKPRHQIVIVDEKAKNKVVKGVSLDLDVKEQGRQPLLIGSGSIVKKDYGNAFLWKLVD